MQLQLFVPGLLWPSEQARGFADALPLPALTTLLGRAQCRREAPAAPEQALRALFGLPEAVDAALRRLGEEDALRVTDTLLCADPAHLHFAREHLLLADAAEFELSLDEARALVEALNAEFGELGRFEAVAPTRWYLQPTRTPAARFASLGAVTSRPIAHFLPEGGDALRWQRAMNEIQVIFHNHPVNAEREARGARAINSVWFWGAGALPASLAAPAPRLAMASELSRGLARAAGVEPSAAARLADLPAGDALVELDALLAPSRYLDLERWQAALARIEADWFAPALAALRARRIERLTLVAPDERGGVTLELTPRRLLHFWRRVQSLEAFTLLQR